MNTFQLVILNSSKLLNNKQLLSNNAT